MNAMAHTILADIPAYELRLRFPEDVLGAGSSLAERISGARGRALVKRLYPEIDPRMLWHSHDGGSINMLPTVRWGAGRGLLRLTVLGEPDFDLAMEQMPGIMRGIRKLSGSHAKLETLSTPAQLTLDPSNPGRRTYHCHNLVISSKKKHIDAFSAADHVARHATLIELIERGIARQCEAFDISPPSMRLIPAEPDAPLKSEYLALTAAPGGSMDDARINAAFVPRYAFLSPIAIKGPWHAGHGLSKGHGRIALPAPTHPKRKVA